MLSSIWINLFPSILNLFDKFKKYKDNLYFEILQTKNKCKTNIIENLLTRIKLSKNNLKPELLLQTDILRISIVIDNFY